MAMCRCTFSMTTMASSTTSPVPSDAEEGERVDGESRIGLMKAKVPINENRNGDSGNNGSAPIQQEEEKRR